MSNTKMMLIGLLMLAGIVMGITSCAFYRYDANGNYSIYIKRDDFRPDVVEYYTQDITFFKRFPSPSIYMKLYYHKDRLNPELNFYYAVIDYTGGGITQFNKMSFMSGDKIAEVRNNPGNTSFHYSGGETWYSTSCFIVPDEIIKQISPEHVNKIRISDDFHYDKLLSDENVKMIQQFVNYIESLD